jgi:ubiquinone/menaquinone biosynthesis C-methylase UbiE/uncharacterized protein YbaR (Trm112 family)
MITPDMLSILCCPLCRTNELRQESDKQEGQQMREGKMICDACNATYEVHSGIPNLIPNTIESDNSWQTWKDHLAVFQSRREQRIDNPDRLVNRISRKSHTKTKFTEFAKFAQITEGNVLDIGCGPGKFRFKLNDNVKYYGIDPIVLYGTEDFPYARALAEYIPFKDNTFTGIVVLAALDHFQNLDKFFEEAIRVLKPDGKLHIMQSVHEIKGPVSALKTFTHWVKDVMEDIETKGEDKDVPHHMTEHDESSLYKAFAPYFDVTANRRYSDKIYTPEFLFLSLKKKLAT